MNATSRPVGDAQAGSASAREEKTPSNPGSTSATGEPLTKEQEAQVRDLKKRDAQVKAHEQAHAAVGGAYASAPTYTYTKGPDGKKYAVGGEVQIDTSPERTPDATIRKMDVVIRAALAPAEPSSQDRAVARQAQQQRLEAQQQLAQAQAEERQNGSGQSEEDAITEAGALDSGLMAQIIAQSETSEGTAPEGKAEVAFQVAAAAAAYESTAGLAAQLFGGW